jgi:tetratricopeptide (TPR) repeat protein
MIEKFKSLVGNAYTSLAARHGKFKVAAIGALIAVLLAATPFIIATSAENSRISSQFDSLISSAESKIAAESMKDARTLLGEADQVKPNQEIVASMLGNISAIEADIKNSKQVFNQAKRAEVAGQKLKALKLYRMVTIHRYKLDEIAAKKATSLQRTLVTEKLKLANQFGQSRQYAKAAQVIKEAIKALPDDTRLNEALTKYQERYLQQKRDQAFSRLRGRYDEFKDITWYRDYSSPTYINRDGFFVYFGYDSNGVTDLHLKMQYFADDWLFIDRASVNVDGETFSLSESSFDRDNDSTIWEWQDITIIGDTSNELILGRDILEKIAYSNSAIVRYSGSQYYHDEYISATQKRAIRNVLEAYDLVK